MLRVSDGTIQIKGRTIDIMAELASLINHLWEKEILDKDMIEEVVKIAFMSNDEVIKKAENIERAALKEFLDDFRKFLDDLKKEVDKSE